MDKHQKSNHETQRCFTLPSPEELREVFPLSDVLRRVVTEQRQAVHGVLFGEEKRLLVVCGPCSISDEESALEYADRLKGLSDLVSDVFLMVMRVYVQKPRTTVGWKGFFYDPELDDSLNIRRGVFATRRLMLGIVERGLPIASEVVDPLGFDYFSDLVSWACIGARTCESQPHREYASSLSLPIGIKNSTQGSVLAAAQGVLAVGSPHARLVIDGQGKYAVSYTKGNHAGHAVLRGGIKPNYDEQSLLQAESQLRELGVSERIVVDCSHGNSRKAAENQPRVFKEVIETALAAHPNVKGMMLESNLYWGSQKLSEGFKPGVSLTDPCLDWETTENLIISSASRLREAFRFNGRCDSACGGDIPLHGGGVRAEGYTMG
jgi:3-deoxy-7-phosphoheptulonate synthase